MSDPIIGKIIEGNAARDAVHIAIAPVVAGEYLRPGTPVGFQPNGTVASYINKHIGIVDPFLGLPVDKGQKFYLFLFPKTVKNLRHEWDHPDFRQSPETEASVGWLQRFASEHQMTYGDLMAAVGEFVDKGCDYPTIEDDFKDWEVPEEFWVHYKAVTGKDGSGDFFGCCI